MKNATERPVWAFLRSPITRFSSGITGIRLQPRSPRKLPIGIMEIPAEATAPVPEAAALARRPDQAAASAPRRPRTAPAAASAAVAAADSAAVTAQAAAAVWAAVVPEALAAAAAAADSAADDKNTTEKERLRPFLFQLSICLPRKLAMVCASLYSVSPTIVSPSLPIKCTRPSASPSEMIGAAIVAQ